MAPKRWSTEDWLAALADGEAERQSARFAKEAETSRARKPPPETEAARSQRLAADFTRAVEQRAAQERARLAALAKAIVPAKSLSSGVNGHAPDLQRMQVQGAA